MSGAEPSVRGYEIQPGADCGTCDTKRPPIAPHIQMFPEIGPVMMHEVGSMFAYTVPIDGEHHPAIALVHRMTGGLPLGFFYTMDPEACRACAVQLLAMANDLDDGAGRQ